MSRRGALALFVFYAVCAVAEAACGTVIVIMWALSGHLSPVNTFGIFQSVIWGAAASVMAVLTWRSGLSRQGGLE